MVLFLISLASPGTNTYFMDQPGGWHVYMIPIDPKVHDDSLPSTGSISSS